MFCENSGRYCTATDTSVPSDVLIVPWLRSTDSDDVLANHSWFRLPMTRTSA